MTRFQFNILFSIAALGVPAIPIASAFGVEIDAAALAGYGACVTYVLTQRGAWTKPDKEEEKKP
jgi:hypothetical protein